VKSTAYDACADVMRSPQPSHRPLPAYSPRRRHNAPYGRVRWLRRVRMASVASVWFTRVILASPWTGCHAYRSPCAFLGKGATFMRTPTSRCAVLPPCACRSGTNRDRAPRALASWVLGGKSGSVGGNPVISVQLATFRLVCLGMRAPIGAVGRPTSHSRKLGEPGGRAHLAADFISSPPAVRRGEQLWLVPLTRGTSWRGARRVSFTQPWKSLS
jgi:hypothetical protein